MTADEKARIKAEADAKAKDFFNSLRKKREEPQDSPTPKQLPIICPIHHKRFEEHWTPSTGLYYICPICGRSPEESLRIATLNGKGKEETLEQKIERRAQRLADKEEMDFNDALDIIMKTSDGLRHQKYLREEELKKAQGNPYWG